MMRLRRFSVLLLFLVAPALLPALAGTTGKGMDEIARCKAIYEERQTAIAAKTSEAKAAIPKEYTSALEGLVKKMQADGDFAGWEASKTELDRFRRTQQFVDLPATGIPEPLLLLQAEYRTKSPTLEMDGAREVLALSKQYSGRLKTVLTELTKQGRMEEAKAAKAEIDRVESSDEVRSASFVLAEAEAAEDNRRAGDAVLAVQREEDSRSASNSRELEMLKDGFVVVEKMLAAGKGKDAVGHLQKGFSRCMIIARTPGDVNHRKVAADFAVRACSMLERAVQLASDDVEAQLTESEREYRAAQDESRRIRLQFNNVNDGVKRIGSSSTRKRLNKSLAAASSKERAAARLCDSLRQERNELDRTRSRMYTDRSAARQLLSDLSRQR